MRTNRIIKQLAGQTWELHEMPFTPNFVYPVFPSFRLPPSKAFTDNYRYTFAYIEKGHGVWGWSYADLDRIGKEISHRVFRNRDFFPSLRRIWCHRIRSFHHACRAIERVHLDQLSLSRLLVLYQSFLKVYEEEYAISFLTNAIDTHTLKRLVGVPPIVTAPSHRSFSTDEKLALLEIASRFQKFFRLVPKTASEEKVRARIGRSSRLLGALRRHARRYFWLRNNYAHAEVLDEYFFAHEILELFREKENPKARIAEILQNVERTKQAKERAIRTIQLTAEQRILLNLAEQSIAMRDERKAVNMQADHFLMEFLKEFSRRTFVPVSDLIQLTSPELVRLLWGARLDARRVQRRREACLMADVEGRELILEGAAATRAYRQILPPTRVADDSTIRGTVACEGKIRGLARIILGPSQFPSMRSGDILVTTMTRPEFVPVMEKAAAIVTDEGGITCHAAIVSRELNIPCVIGTKVATRVLKDGERVEVDATHGVIRRLQAV